MAEYSYLCDACGTEAVVEQPMHANHDPGPCPDCRAPMRRLWDSHTHGDEVRGSTYFHPDRKCEVKDHGRVFDLGLGEYYATKSERRKLIKAKGLKEIGIREV